ncbi:WXG100 family type VII secretion target [Mycobacterium sp. SMC-4]|uniref:WXG100 family type VII secretion target n=1 Tax=Mycobacterium sp. SMC-4 TaxID=2857059 RepID=UPI003D03F5F1
MLVVDFAQLRAAIRHMEEFGQEVAACLEEVEQAMAALRTSWHGDGSDAQAQAQQQWEDGAEQMKTALTALQRIAEGADKNYSDAVNKNGQMWQA